MEHESKDALERNVPYELPPKEQRLWDAQKQGRLPTPLDEQGLVDLDGLVELGRSTVDSAYDWSSREDIHHLQWPKVLYLGNKLHHEFRELRQRKVRMPRTFHNWIHMITTPPPVPEAEVIRQHTHAEKVALRLASTVELAVKLTRNTSIPDRRLNSRLEEVLDLFVEEVEHARAIPPEFQLVPVGVIEAKNIDDLLAVSKQMGKCALHKIRLRSRVIRTRPENKTGRINMRS